LPKTQRVCASKAGKEVKNIIEKLEKAGYQGYTLGPGDPRTQKEAIMAAGYGYYGSNAPIDRLGGCSYGEFVYKHCDPSYQCKAAQ